MRPPHGGPRSSPPSALPHTPSGSHSGYAPSVAPRAAYPMRIAQVPPSRRLTLLRIAFLCLIQPFGCSTVHSLALLPLGRWLCAIRITHSLHCLTRKRTTHSHFSTGMIAFAHCAFALFRRNDTKNVVRRGVIPPEWFKCAMRFCIIPAVECDCTLRICNHSAGIVQMRDAFLSHSGRRRPMRTTHLQSFRRNDPSAHYVFESFKSLDTKYITRFTPLPAV